MKYGIHWFRRDLRIAGNPALLRNWTQNHGRVLGIFAFDKSFLAREDFSHNRFAFFLKTLEDLKIQLQSSGGDLLFLDVGPEDAFRSLFSQMKEKSIPLPSNVSFNRDYEPFAIQRDAKLEKLFKNEFGITILSERDHLVIEPHEIKKDGAQPFYQVYTPFNRSWTKLFGTASIQERIVIQKRGLSFARDFEKNKQDAELFKLTWKQLIGSKLPETYSQGTEALFHYTRKTLSKIDIKLPQAGTIHALNRLKIFKKNTLTHYETARDIPSIPGTSQMSIFLKNGSITTAQIIALCNLSPGRYLNELIWREFYYHILAHRPEVETEAFQAKYSKLNWENNDRLFKAWQDGMTGYPIVDAGMRQLKETGWMHNRVRMIVASFLTKDLLVDYRWGEKHFMKLLLDGDLAPNNGGWQWAASTGCDPQPYFRIFNPMLQSQRFDPEGKYIRQYIPELKDLDNDDIHEPWSASQKTAYPARVVDHAVQKVKALALFKTVGKSSAQN